MVAAELASLEEQEANDIGGSMCCGCCLLPLDIHTLILFVCSLLLSFSQRLSTRSYRGVCPRQHGGSVTRGSDLTRARTPLSPGDQYHKALSLHHSLKQTSRESRQPLPQSRLDPNPVMATRHTRLCTFDGRSTPQAHRPISCQHLIRVSTSLRSHQLLQQSRLGPNPVVASRHIRQCTFGGRSKRRSRAAST